MAEILPDIETFARIKVVGVGGGGGNALNRMVQSKLRGIDFVAINTDAQALHYSQANKKVHIGKEATKGLGARLCRRRGDRNVSVGRTTWSGLSQSATGNHPAFTARLRTRMGPITRAGMHAARSEKQAPEVVAPLPALDGHHHAPRNSQDPARRETASPAERHGDGQGADDDVVDGVIAILGEEPRLPFGRLPR